eukprot:443689_1
MMRALTDAVKEYEEPWIEFGKNNTHTQCTFTLLQGKAKQMEQIPDEKRVSLCFVFSLIPLSCVIMEDALIAALKSNITHDMGALAHYIETALSTLNHQRMMRR